MKAFMDEKGYEYTYFDIGEKMSYLKAFLKHRDNAPAFDEVKREGRVGIPVVIIDGEYFFTPEDVEKKMNSIKN